MKKYTTRVPCTLEQGAFKTVTYSTWGVRNKQDAIKEALLDYNSARSHDGLAPLLKLPRGTKTDIEQVAQ